MTRVVLAAVGTLGDLHPLLVLGIGLAGRGHEVSVACASAYRGRVRRAGLIWRRLRPELPAGSALAAAMGGLEPTLHGWVLPGLQEMTADLLAAAEGADLVIGSSLVLALADVTERLRVPGVAVCLQPLLMGAAGPFAASRWLTLALFSAVLGAPEPGWPAGTVQTGFLFADAEADGFPLPAGLAEFLAAGPAPVVFTLGSAAVHVAGDFYPVAAAAAAALGVRAILLTGPAAVPAPLPGGVACFGYIPYGSVFPHAAAVVHQGGVGTTAQALRAGRPMVVVPFAFDQEDNAARVARLGAGVRLERETCDGARLTAALGSVLNDRQMAARCETLGRAVAEEEGLRVACDAVEAVLHARCLE